MESGAEGINFGKLLILIIVVMIVVGFSVALVTNFKGQSEATVDDLDALLASTADTQFASYNNSVVSGSDIESCANMYKGQDYTIAVVTFSGSGNYYVQSNPQLVGTPYFYNALPDGITVAGGVATGASIDYDTDKGIYSIDSLSYDEENGLTNQNPNFAPMTNRSMVDTYIKSNGRYYANLIVDTSSGELAGFLFQQMQ